MTLVGEEVHNGVIDFSLVVSTFIMSSKNLPDVDGLLTLHVIVFDRVRYASDCMSFKWLSVDVPLEQFLRSEDELYIPPCLVLELAQLNVTLQSWDTN